ncbi:MAG: APA family basic amino acid/polyamine antiporter, partial [Myxococcota bacterium]
MKTLERRLGLTAVLAISMSAMLGSGLFVLPGLAAAKTGPSIWLAYLVAGLCVLPAALSKAELATAMPTSGGTYVYLDRAFGPLAGTVSGLGLWASLLLKSAFALVGFGAYLSVLADVPLKITALCLLVVVLFINISGATAVGKL